MENHNSCNLRKVFDKICVLLVKPNDDMENGVAILVLDRTIGTGFDELKHSTPVASSGTHMQGRVPAVPVRGIDQKLLTWTMEGVEEFFRDEVESTVCRHVECCIAFAVRQHGIHVHQTPHHSDGVALYGSQVKSGVAIGVENIEERLVSS